MVGSPHGKGVDADGAKGATRDGRRRIFNVSLFSPRGGPSHPGCRHNRWGAEKNGPGQYRPLYRRQFASECVRAAGGLYQGRNSVSIRPFIRVSLSI